MRRDQLIKFIIAQRIKMYESEETYAYDHRIKELQAVIEIIDGLAQLEEDDMQENPFHQFMEMFLNSKHNKDTEQ